MQGFQDAFAAYGADYQATMPRFMGNEVLYLRLLEMLFQDENLRLLGDALNAGDFDGAFSAAHALKGVTANLGLTPLFDVVCAIVDPLRVKAKRDDYPVLYENIIAGFQRADEFRKTLKEGELA